MKAKIKKDNQVILADVDVELSESTHPVNQLTSWRGSFALGEGEDIAAGPYEIELQDGRKGRIVVIRSDYNNGFVTAIFEGAGLLV